MPEHLAEVLDLANTLADYGRCLIATLEQRALRRSFATIAQCFGTATVAVILAHLYRGLMRAIALQQFLLERARRGRDLRVLMPRRHAPRPPRAPDPDAAPPPAPATRPDRAAAEPLTLDNLPSMPEIEAEVRRRAVGQSLVDICRDLGVSPALCATPFWSRLFDAISCYRGSLGNIVLEMRRREMQFARDDWQYPHLALPELTRDGNRKVLGFFIGEPPVDPPAEPDETGYMTASPAAPIPAAATGPP